METETLAGTKFDIEHENSISTVGAARAGSGDDSGKNRFNGYMYELKIYNTNRSETQITNLINENCTVKGATTCSFCPVDSTDDLSDGVCISECKIGTYGDNCTDCEETGCTDNCRYSDGCEHCDNRLCNTCETFLANAICMKCKAFTKDFSIVDPDDCVCDDQHALDDEDWECTCATGCNTCNGLFVTQCLSCSTNYYLLPNTSFCLDYCP